MILKIGPLPGPLDLILDNAGVRQGPRYFRGGVLFFCIRGITIGAEWWCLGLSLLFFVKIGGAWGGGTLSL